MLRWQKKRSKIRPEIGPQQTSKPRPEPVVVTVKEPIQDPGENCAVVVGGRLLLSLRGGQAETRRREEGESKETLRRNNTLALVKEQGVEHDMVIVIN